MGNEKMKVSQNLQYSKPAACQRVPAGCLAVYVGEERRRFVIPASYLNLPVFAALLEKSEEEFGYRSPNGLLLPCEVSSFVALLHQLKAEGKRRKEKQKAHASLTLFFSRACKVAARLTSKNMNRDVHSAPLLYKDEMFKLNLPIE